LEIELAARFVEHINRAATCVRQGAGVLEDARQHYFQLERRAYCPSNLPQCLLLLDGPRKLMRAGPHLLKQPRVFDGDDGLVGEGLKQRDLLVGEWSRFLSVQQKYAQKVPIPQQRQANDAAKITQLLLPLLTIKIRIGQNVGNSHRLALECDTTSDAG